MQNSEVISAIKRGHHWKGGKTVTQHGYVLIHVGKEHHLADCRGYAYEHRLVAEQKLGRRLLAGEIPHHINGQKADNRPENLEVTQSPAEHRLRHRIRATGLRLPGEENPVYRCACGCGGTFPKYDSTGRPRRYISGHNPHATEVQERLIQCAGAGPLAIRAIAASTGQSARAATTMASRLVKAGKLVRIKRGVYGKRN